MRLPDRFFVVILDAARFCDSSADSSGHGPDSGVVNPTQTVLSDSMILSTRVIL